MAEILLTGALQKNIWCMITVELSIAQHHAHTKIVLSHGKF